MTTQTVTAEVRYPVGHWADMVRVGDTVVAIDGVPTGEPRTVVAFDGDVVVLTSGGITAARVYPDNHESLTVAREVPWQPSQRTLRAIRRTSRYVWLLRRLRDTDGPYFATRGDGVSLAAMATQNGYNLTERVGRGWRITETGRATLAYHEEHSG